MKKYVFLFLSSFLILAFQNCTNQGQQFTEAVNLASSTASCQPDSTTITRPTKILFLVDASGSNEGDHGAPGSDENKVWRASVIQQLLDQNGGNTYVHYGLVAFQGDDAFSFINQNWLPVFTNNLGLVDTGVNAFLAMDDDGSTPYKAAFGMATSMIRQDLSVNSAQNAGYAIVMLSDGAPTDYDDGHGGVDDEAIISDVQSLVGIAPERISFNTVYYYNPANGIDKSASERLQKMAAAGSGLAQVMSSQLNLNIAQGIQLPNVNCP